MNQVEFEQIFNHLPKRRKEVLLRVLGGETDAEIASSLKIGQTSIRKHIERVSEDFGLKEQSLGRSKRSDILNLFVRYKPELLNTPASVVVPSKQPPKTANAATRKQQDWGEAPDIPLFYGRTEELATLETWIFSDSCRLIGVLGMGGIGKTALCVKLAQRLQDQFEFVIWRSLQYSPPFSELLAELVQFLSGKEETLLEEDFGKQISQLMHYLRTSRCLLVFDNVEAVMQSQQLAGYYRKGYEAYGELLKHIGETLHQSCLLLCSREKPVELVSLEGDQLPVRTLQLQGLSPEEGQNLILFTKDLGQQEEGSLSKLVKRYGGNPTALKLVATTIKDLFSGNVRRFLEQEDLVIGDILGKLIKEQFERVSAPEIQMIYWLTLYNQALSPLELQRNIILSEEVPETLSVLESLRRRSLLEKVKESDTAKFTLQPIVNQYATHQLITRIIQSISTEELETIDVQEIFEHLGVINFLDESFSQKNQISPDYRNMVTKIAKQFNKIGHKNYLGGEFKSAKFYFMLSLTFDDNYATAHYNLGSSYEKLKEISLAYRHYYQAATKIDDKAAHAAINNLARLKIIEQGDFAEAINLILPILDKVENIPVKANLHKNLGWAYFEQGDHRKAEEHLQHSIEIEGSRAAAYCLLAKVKHAQGKERESLISWQNFLKYEFIEKEKGSAWNLPELGVWKLEARRILEKSNLDLKEDIS